jgi:Tol biopolymer transport system component
MTHIRWGWSAAVLLGLVAVVGVGVRGRTRGAAVAGPLVQITSPASGFKLRQGRTMAVRVSVHPRTRPVREWRLQLLDTESNVTDLAAGTEPVDNREVAQVAAADLVAGETYTLLLQGTDAAGTSETAQVEFLIPDPQYTLIPLEPGNNSRPLDYGMSMDRTGTLVAMGGSLFGDIVLVDTASNSLRTIHLDLQGSGDFRLSGDGRHLVFGSYRPAQALLILDLQTQEITLGPYTWTAALFSVDAAAQRIVFQSGADLNSLQYFLYDDATKTTQQLTQYPNAIDYSGPCSTEPEISADGTSIAFATTATLGLVPEDPSVGCRVFVYDVATGVTRQALALPSGLSHFSGAVHMSADGRWFSFSFTRVVPPGILMAFPTLLDLWTGEFVDPVGGITGSASFDSAVSPDGSTVVVSSQADLDPRVGNADQNGELFAYDRATAQFSQISDTTGGLTNLPGTCDAYKPLVSADAGVVAYGFYVMTVPPCYIEAAQRNEADGFVFHRVRAVRKRPGNHPPVLEPVGAVRVQAGQTLSLNFSASDPDGDPIVFFAQLADGADVPPGSKIEDHRDGTAALTWPTKPQNIGTYPMRVAAFDEGGGETLEDFTITVCSNVVNDAGLPGVVAAIFESEPNPPAACHDAELNGDGAITAADVVKAGAGNLTARQQRYTVTHKSRR